MFNGMMDPDLLRMAQEQMSRMSPSDFARIQQQMMSNPDLMRMASESMKNMRPEDLKQAAEQLKHVRPEDMAEIGEKMANASPEEIASMRARADAQMTYQLNAAQLLKKEGNELHSQGRFMDASQKYLRAKSNLKDIPSSKGKALMLTCSLNLMSCYLKTRQYDECIKEGSEVLADDSKNVKALYRRGQAYKEIGRLGDAVSDLRKAHEVSPDDETVAEVLRDAEARLTKEGGSVSRGVMIEEITEDVETVSTSSKPENILSVQSEEKVPNIENSLENQVHNSTYGPTTSTECLRALRDDPESIRSFQNFISNADPEALAAMGTGNTGEISPDMVKTASSMIGKMSPEELQKMIKLASSFPSEGPFGGAGPSDNSSNSFTPGSLPNFSPEMLKTASDMMSKMSPDDLQRMFEMPSSLRGIDSFPAGAASNSGRSTSSFKTKSADTENEPAIARDILSSEASSSHLVSSDFGSVPNPSWNFPAAGADMQEQMRNQLKDPAMRQMFSSMMKNMSPEMMANMGEQFGFRLSKEDAARAQQAMSSLSPEALDKMMCWADRIQRGVETARTTKNWLLGRPGMILAICMLLLAVILHRLGYIGR
ncbi:hypothetical protein MLD38_004118 [Melastoma candidum]|uniref:Uncharacterized protein n=1 Tax=Melastoma candidum TaxID=119954 RepID=A0ACB9S4U1_9MYRT|nr:hypothetical protein MLD38_004118 [Melastoma candidum]